MSYVWNPPSFQAVLDQARGPAYIGARSPHEAPASPWPSRAGSARQDVRATGFAGHPWQAGMRPGCRRWRSARSFQLRRASTVQGQMGRVIAVANQKGGVGKTTTAVNLGACLAQSERRVLLIDLDPQANATSGCGAAAESLHGSTYDVLTGQTELGRILHPVEQLPLLSLAPAHIRLAGIEVEMATVFGRERRLAEALAPVADEFDFILIDCPPSLGTLTINALTAADSVLIPVQCEYYALEGLSKLFSTVRLVQRYLNPGLQIEGVLLTMYDERLQLSRRVALEVRDYFGAKVYRTNIRRNVTLAEAPSHVIRYNPVSTGAENYADLAQEVCAALDGERSAAPAVL